MNKDGATMHPQTDVTPDQGAYEKPQVTVLGTLQDLTLGSKTDPGADSMGGVGS